MDTHVITIGLEFADGQLPPAFTCELFRGAEEECRELKTRISATSCDTRRVANAYVNCGTIAEWEHFLRS